MESINGKRYGKKYGFYQEVKNVTENKEPIRRGCQHQQCFCTGACQEIIGWREKEVYGLGSIAKSIRNKKLGI